MADVIVNDFICYLHLPTPVAAPSPMAFKQQLSMCSSVSLNWPRVDTGTFPPCPSKNGCVASEGIIDYLVYEHIVLCIGSPELRLHLLVHCVLPSFSCTLLLHPHPVVLDHFQPAQISSWIRLHLIGALRSVEMLTKPALHAATNPTSALCHTRDSASSPYCLSLSPVLTLMPPMKSTGCWILWTAACLLHG